MPYARPTFTQLRDGALQDIAAEQIYDTTTDEVVDPLLLLFDPLTIQAKVMAGLAYEEYGYLDYIALQATPYTATDEAALAWGALVGLTLKGATTATGTAQFTGQVGVDIPAGTGLSRSDGATYVTTADMPVPASGTAIVSFEATTAGALFTVVAGMTLTISQPIEGVTSKGVVLTSTAPGADIEDMDAFKARYLLRYASPPAGGSQTDYVEWAEAVSGVTRAWCVPNGMGAGTVTVFVMLDVSQAAFGGFPQGTNGVAAAETRAKAATGDQLTVANYIDPLRPVTALVYVAAPVPDPLPFVIANLGTANTTANKTAITAALQAILLAVGDPRGQTILPSYFETAIAQAIGSAPFTLVSPNGPVIVPFGQLPTVGSVTMTS